MQVDGNWPGSVGMILKEVFWGKLRQWFNKRYQIDDKNLFRVSEQQFYLDRLVAWCSFLYIISGKIWG